MKAIGVFVSLLAPAVLAAAEPTNLDQFLALPLSDGFKRKATVETPLSFFPDEPKATH